MDQIRQHHLYPKLVALVSRFRNDDPERKIEKLVRDVPQDELTITRLLYHACGWRVGDIDYAHAKKLYRKLSKAKPDGITPDGYLAKYEVTYDQVWSGIVEDLARFGVTAERDCGNSDRNGEQVRVWYTALPDINTTTLWKWHKTPYEIHAYRSRFDLNLTALQAKIVGKYGTPYPAEVIALRLIAQLPQPIAETITDCIHGVMERRFTKFSSPALSYSSQLAFERELDYTAYPHHIYIPEDLKVPDRRNWEAIVAPIIEKKLADDAACKLRLATMRQNSSDDDFGPTCVYARYDDGW